jgi:sugar phosphate permease
MLFDSLITSYMRYEHAGIDGTLIAGSSSDSSAAATAVCKDS